MQDILFGMETELAFSALQADMPDAEQETLFELPMPIASALPAALLDLWVREFLSLAGEQLCCLPDGQGFGHYLANGSRLYLDAGRHPEFCTPECGHPEQLVRWQVAGEQILTSLGEELMKRRPNSQIALFRCNVDYAGTQSTWGCHESYQHESDEAQMRAHLIPHLVTRIVYTGAGGLNNRQTQAEFLLSPRVPHLLHEAGGNSQSERSLYHTKNEPLGRGGFNRLHLLCGESNASQLSTYLKMGTTALIVRLIDAGVCRGDALRFRRPIRSMNVYARDPACRKKLRIQSGRRLTAVEVQREYLAMVEKHLDADFMPDWAPQVCERWRGVLDRLTTDPTSLSTSLDWAIKHALFEDRLARSNTTWKELEIAGGLGAELCEIDTRFGELGEAGLFHSLDRAGALDHRLPELGSIEGAMSTPPAGGRAEVRGRAIRELRSSTQPRRYQCEWSAIFDKQEGRVYDMGDPHGREAHWRALAELNPLEHPSMEDRMLQRISSQLRCGVRLYRESNLSSACEVLSVVAAEARGVNMLEAEALARFWCATAQHDAGRLQAAEDILTPILETVCNDTASVIACRVLTRYALVLIDRPADRARIEEAVARVRACIEGIEGDSGSSRLGMVEARLQGILGNYDRAIEIMQGALEAASSDRVSFARSTYLRWLVYYLLRTGRLERASRYLDQWRDQNELSRPESRVMLACAESMLARLRGRFADALEHARGAVTHGDSPERNRYLTRAQCALIECAVAAGEADIARTHVEEIETWRDVEIGEQRCDLELAKAAFYRAVAQRPTAETVGPDGFAQMASGAAGPGGPVSWNDAAAHAEEAAHSIARRLDEQLGTAHHVREVGEGCRPVG